MTEPLKDKSELTYRQIHPNFLKKGVPVSNRFMPSARDENKLSVDRGSMLSAAESHANYQAIGLRSSAVFGVTVGEFSDEGIPTHSDPIDPKDGKPGNPAHALAVYSAFDEVTQKQIALRLCKKAINRGTLHSE
jgi:hypothetical protein